MRTPSAFRLLRACSLAAVSLAIGGLSGAAAQTIGAQLPALQYRAEVIEAAIREASLRFGVPEPWIRAVMRVESAGDARAVSRAGAIGLMQVMPATYAGLRRRHDLGPDPFDPRDNILAGTAYLREMHDRYGRTGMLAAYNAGPGRWEEHLRGARRLPNETLAYVARLAPAVGARSLAVAASAPVARTVAAPPQTMFVSVERGTSAIGAPSEERAASDQLADRRPVESVFVGRGPAARDASDEDAKKGFGPVSNPLFAPFGGAGGGR